MALPRKTRVPTRTGIAQIVYPSGCGGLCPGVRGAGRGLSQPFQCTSLLAIGLRASESSGRLLLRVQWCKPFFNKDSPRWQQIMSNYLVVLWFNVADNLWKTLFVWCCRALRAHSLLKSQKTVHKPKQSLQIIKMYHSLRKSHSIA